MTGQVDHAVVMSGIGIGSTAAFEVGVLKALCGEGCPHLENHKLDPSIYSGSVLGGLNAAIMVSRTDASPSEAIEYLEKVWLEDVCSSSVASQNGVFRLRGNPFPLYSQKDPSESFLDMFQDAAFLWDDFTKRMLDLPAGDGSLTEKLLDLPSLTPFFDMKPFNDLLKKHVDLSKLRQSEKELLVIATDWKAGKPRVFEKGDFTDQRGHRILSASAAIALTFPPVEIDGRDYVGGGISMATPLQPVIQRKSRKTARLVIHVILLDLPVEQIPMPNRTSLLASFNRFLNMQQAGNLDDDLERAAKVNERLRRRARDRTTLRGDSSSKARDRLAGWQKDIDDKVPLDIHIYRPRTHLGVFLESLNFDRKKTEGYIEEGLKAARDHDCDSEGCLRSDSARQPPST